MINLSKKKREKLIDFLNILKENNKDNEEYIQAIGEIETELNSKKYGLVWEKHEEEVDVKMKTNIPVFTEVKDREIQADKNGKYNFLLEGDNLHSLKLLQKTHNGKIDVIYIDPPYNTKNKEFIYNDKMIGEDDGYRHSKWLSFMSERLEIAKDLLSDDGVIFISIDDNEQAQLKLLCDSIFGEGNFINCISINMSNMSGPKIQHAITGKRFPKVIEYLLVYVKDHKKYSMKIPKRKKEKWDPEYNLIIPELTENFQVELDNLSSKELNEKYKNLSLMSLNNYMKEHNISGNDEEWKKKNFYKIFASKPNTALLKKAKSINEYHGDIYIITNSTGSNKVIKTDFNRNTRTARIELVSAKSNSDTFYGDHWEDIYTTGGIAQEGGIGFDNGKKPLKMIKRIVNTNINTNAIILDFFAGSGTTGHAVMQLNKEDGGSRTYIMCTNNENKIAEEITYKRMVNIQSELPHNLKYYKTDFIDKDDEELTDKMLEHIEEMVQLERGVKIDNNEYVLVLSDSDADKLTANISKYDKLKAIYMSSDVLLSGKQKRILEDYEINIIPDYYFGFELREAGLIW